MIQQTTPQRAFQPFPAYDDRAAWDALPERDKKDILDEGRKRLDMSWESLPAMRYMDYVKNGNRARYEGVYFARRAHLAALAMAECVEGKGAFINDIINGVWLICEETTWVVPAHNQHYPSFPVPSELGNIEQEPYIDLFASETASLLTWVYYFLAEKIAEVSPVAKRRIELEIERRILTPYIRHEDYNWTGLTHSQPVNNWNPWINSNMLVCLLVFGKLYPRHASAGIDMAIRSINRFLYFYAEDGGCDEGPGYFGRAGASALDFIETLGYVSDVDYLYREPLIKNMAAYIYRVYIAGDYFVNYADASPRVSPSADLLARVGQKIGDSNLIGAASHFKKVRTGEKHGRLSRLSFRGLQDLFVPSPEADFNAPVLSWFPGIQVLCARDREADAGGLFFSAKGGHNNESHNHNDVGNFILYRHGRPVIVDAGVETYTKQTFSDRRYDIWTMQSKNHNTPTLNGYEQCPGVQYQAHDVRMEDTGDITCLHMQIEKAYPAEAGVTDYKRSFRFERGRGLTVTDRYRLQVCIQPAILNFLCAERPQVEGGRVCLPEQVEMRYDAEAFSAAVEEIKLTDKKLRDAWERESLYILRLTAKAQALEGEYRFSFAVPS